MKALRGKVILFNTGKTNVSISPRMVYKWYEEKMISNGFHADKSFLAKSALNSSGN
jgi:hypothetical protein